MSAADAETEIEPIVVSPKEAMRIMDCSHSTLYEILGRGELEAYSDGRRTKITVASIRRRLEGLPRAKIGNHAAVA